LERAGAGVGRGGVGGDGWSWLVDLSFLSVLACSMDGHGNQSGRLRDSHFGSKTGCCINVPGSSEPL
jgi:hypothetical protein